MPALTKDLQTCESLLLKFKNGFFLTDIVNEFKQEGDMDFLNFVRPGTRYAPMIPPKPQSSVDWSELTSSLPQEPIPKNALPPIGGPVTAL